ncbi:hypothetical protein [Sporosalibacterium faouarense]|uniref:hypothetical protein n=1 Tax=Sporosalibacterium faouarense TaxID=516123 RepID=UPI00141D1259|nr:hypothetical protein [Sporosalibacterium faouarense]MTI47949.1 hypothetical protein [Bacillota bacterium]
MKKSKLIVIVLILVVIVIGIGKCEGGVPCLGSKPVIYLYPEEKTEVQVKLEFDGDLLVTYPTYNDEWNVLANPDGSLTNLQDGKEYSYLFWEGEYENNWDINEGFVVKGENTAEFLQEKLAYLGLSPKEYNEFIVYWLPLMKGNNYNLIHFAGNEYADLANLTIKPKPDSIQRVFMVFKPLDKYTEIKTQELKPFERSGFTVIEWGGTKID